MLCYFYDKLREYIMHIKNYVENKKNSLSPLLSILFSIPFLDNFLKGKE